MPEGPDGGRRVTMLVRNPFTHDTRVEKEAATLRDAGYRITIVADAGPGLPAREERDGIVVVRVPRRFRVIPLLRFVAGEIERVAIVVRTRPQILHAHDSNALLAVALAAARVRRPFVYDAHELWAGRPPRGRSRAYVWLTRLWYRLVERMTLPRAAACLTVSPPIADELARAYRLDDVVLVENFPDAGLAGDGRVASLRDLPDGESIPSAAPVVLYMGGFMVGRGLEGLIEATVSVPEAHLVLLGYGPLGDALGRLAERLGVGGRVHRLGPVPSREVIAYARSADVGVEPVTGDTENYRNSLSNKLFGYMAAGLPVIASDLPQIRDVVDGLGAGVMVGFDRPRALVVAINGLLEDPEVARAMGERGRQAVLDRFNWDEAGGRLLAVYRRVTDIPDR